MEGGSQSRSEEELEKQGTPALGNASRPQVLAASGLAGRRRRGPAGLG